MNKLTKFLNLTILLVFLSLISKAQVGVNTTTPTKMLDVNGTLRVRSLDDGSSATNFNQVLVTSADGTIGKVSRSSLIKKYHLFSSEARKNVTGKAFVQQPGLSQTFTLSAPASVIIWASIGAFLPSSATPVSANIDVAVFIDGIVKEQGGFGRFTITSATSSYVFSAIAINTLINLPAGSHTIDLRTGLADNSASNLTIGGSAITGVNPGEMTIQVLY